MENEIMENEEFIEETYEETEGSSGMPTGLAMLIGSGITLGLVAGVKKLKKVWNKRKAEKELVEVVCTEDGFGENIVDSEEVK